MAGGVLLVSRFINLFSYWKEAMEKFGFKDVLVTGQEKDSLNSVIREFKPSLVLIGSGFYSRSTPYMTLKLLKDFPKLNIAAVNICDFPDDQAMYFILNGVNSYLNKMEGMDEFIKGLKLIRDGKHYISPGVLKRINMRNEYPEAAKMLAGRVMEVARLTCYGFKDFEIAGTLHVSRRTVNQHNLEVYRSLNVRTFEELYGVASNLGIINPKGDCVFPKGYEVKPFPNRKKREKGKINREH